MPFAPAPEVVETRLFEIPDARQLARVLLGAPSVEGFSLLIGQPVRGVGRPA